MPVICRMNIHERQGRFILINFLAGAGSSDNSAEDAFTGAHVAIARVGVLPAQRERLRSNDDPKPSRIGKTHCFPAPLRDSPSGFLRVRRVAKVTDLILRSGRFGRVSKDCAIGDNTFFRTL